MGPSRNAVLILALSLLSAITPLAIDMALPGFASLESDLGLAPGAGANTVSIFLLGFALGPLWFGPLSDHVGRKPVLYAGILLFSTGGLLCYLADSAWLFFAGRLLQGVGAGVCSSIPLAIVRDSFEGLQGRRVLTLITLVMGVAPIVAPVIGAAVVATLGWRHVFSILWMTGAVLLLFVILGLRETRVATTARNLSLRPMLAAYRTALGNRVFVGYGLANGFSVGCMFAFIASSPAVFMGRFGVPAATFGLIFAVIAAGIIVGATLNDRLLSRALPPAGVLAAALFGSLASALLLLVSALAGIATVTSTLALLVLNNLCSGMIRPNATHEAMQPLPHIAGSASALFRAVQMLLGAIAAAAVSTVAPAHALLAMAGVMSGTALVSLLMFWWVSVTRSSQDMSG